MADILNLRRARKRRGRAEKERDAAANRAMHGRSAAEKATDRLSREIEAKRIEGHRRKPSSQNEPSA